MAIQIRRGTNSQWESNKSNIVAGEPAIATDTGRLFVGTGAGTYQEYAQATRMVNGHPLTSDVEVFAQDIPSKNLLSYNCPSSYTTNGITYTVNADGSITANGTATALSTFIFSSSCFLKAGTYILNGCPIGGSSTTYEISLGVHNILSKTNDYGNGATFTLQNDLTLSYVQIVVRSGQTVSNKVFYPMIRPSTITDGTYVPYSATNIELTKKTYLTQDQYTNIANNANLIAVPNKSGSITGYYIEYTVNNGFVSSFALKAETTYTLTATITSNISGFYIDVGCGNGDYARTIANVTRSSSGNVYTITFTPSSADIAVGKIFAIRMPRYGSSQTFTYSVSNVSLTYGTVNGLTLNDVLSDLADSCTYKSGESIKLQSGTIVGMITSGSTLVALTVYVDKSMKNISSITVSKCTGALRGGSGYVNGSTNDTNWLTTSGITVSAEKISERTVYLYLSSTTALTNVTNNSPVVLSGNPLQLTFN